MKVINTLKRAAKYRVKILFSKLGLVKSKISEPKEQWQNVAQEFEFAFHKTNQFRQTEQFNIESKLLFDSFGFHEEEYKQKNIVDLGAGSKMRGKYFKDARIYVIEPMADRCIAEIPWCDLDDAEKVYSLPAEERILELDNKVDFLFSINVLDHCFNFEKIIQNIHSYLKSGGLAFLSFDSHYHVSVGHPLVITENICNEIFLKNSFIISKMTKGFPSTYANNYKKKGYDGVSSCLNYWLIKK